MYQGTESIKEFPMMCYTNPLIYIVMSVFFCCVTVD